MAKRQKHLNHWLEDDNEEKARPGHRTQAKRLLTPSLPSLKIPPKKVSYIPGKVFKEGLKNFKKRRRPKKSG